MITIVYVHVGAGKTEYLTMLRVSAASVRKHMKDVGIVILTDTETGAFLEQSETVSDSGIRIEAVAVPQGYNTVEKSRYLKTRMREFVKGDLLYLDSDTIVCQDISDTVVPASVCMVRDEHCLLSQQEENGEPIKRAARDRGLDLDRCTDYYNGGVIMAKDDENARIFFRRWFETWDATRKPQMHHDQYSLNFVNQELNVIRELGGEWNCQLTGTYRAFSYLRNVKILHYLSAQPYGYYRLNDLLLLQRELSDKEIDEIISAPEQQFLPFHTYADSSVEYQLMQQSHFHLIHRLYTRHRRLYDFGEKLLKKLRK